MSELTLVDGVDWAGLMKTEKAALNMAKKALPCPFCGERLVVASDHHGYWLQHRELFGPCFDNVVQVASLADLTKWNTRAKAE